MVTGVDASAEMLAVAQRNADAAKVRVTFAQDDAHRLNFADASFDAVICLRVLMHTPDWKQSLGELCRVARTRVVFDYPAHGERGVAPVGHPPCRPCGRCAHRSLPGLHRRLGARAC